MAKTLWLVELGYLDGALLHGLVEAAATRGRGGCLARQVHWGSRCRPRLLQVRHMLASLHIGPNGVPHTDWQSNGNWKQHLH